MSHLHSKGLRNAAKFLKIGSEIKLLCLKIILNRAFSIVIMYARKITVFAGEI